MKGTNFQNALWEGMELLRVYNTPEKNVRILTAFLTLISMEENQQIELSREETWSIITQSGYGLHEKLERAMKSIEEKCPALEGVWKEIPANDFSEGLLFQVTSTLNKYQRPSLEELAEVTEQFLYQMLDRLQYFVDPPSVNKLLAKILNINTGSFYDGTAGAGLLIAEAHAQAKKREASISIFAQDIDPVIASLGKMNLLIQGVRNFDYRVGDTLTKPKHTNDYGLMTFDYIAMHFSFSIRWDREAVKNELYGRFLYGLPPKNNADMAFILHAIASLNENGKAAFIVSNGVLFRGSTEGKIRQELINHDLIEGVISLPSNLFGATAIPTVLLIINKNKKESRKEKIFFIDASEDFQKERGRNYLREQDQEKILDAFKNEKEIPGYSTSVHLSDISGSELTVQRYFDVDDVESLIGKVTVNSKAFQSSQEPKAKLHELVDIYRGMNMPSKSNYEDKGTNYAVIQLTDVQNGSIQWEQLQTISVKDRDKAAQYFIQEGDVLISARGAAIKIAVVPKIEQEIILSHNFLNLRPKDKVDPQFIKAYLESPLGQYYLTSHQKGSMVQVISVKDIRELLVPSVAFNKQQEIGRQYLEAKEEYQQQLTQIEKQLHREYKQLYDDMGIIGAFENMKV